MDSKTEFGLIPEGWSRGVFEDLTSSISTGGTPKRTEPDYWENGIIPWLTSGEVKSGITTFTKEKITDIGLKNSAAKMWNENTIVVAMYGATAGEVCLLGSPMTTNQACCGLTPQNNSKAFLFLCARTEKERLVSKASGAAQQNLNKGIVANHPCVLPTSDVLDSFEKTVFPLIEKWKANEFQNKALERIRDKILPRLISGKILLSDVNQELKETA